MVDNASVKPQPQDIRQLIRDRLHERGESVNALHQRLGRIDRATLYRFLSGRTDRVNVKKLARILAALDLRIV
jgi:hypothetical protein